MVSTTEPISVIKESTELKKIKLKGKINQSAVKKAANAIAEGIVLLPTKYNYVLVSNDPKRLNSVNQDSLLILNERQKLEPTKFISKSDIEMDSLTEIAQKVIQQFTPGPLIAYLRQKELSSNQNPSNAEEKIGIRVSNSQLINDLLAQSKNPLYFIEVEKTESNILDSEWLRTNENNIVLYLEREIANYSNSTVIDLTTSEPKILKKGFLPILEIEQVSGRRLKIGKDVYFSVLFVCSGNSCRSPIAKGILEKMFEKKNVFVYSAGTIAQKGILPSEFAVIAAKKYGADISHHLSSPLTKELINDADLILVMSPKHKDNVIELVPEAKSKTFLLREYAFGINEEVEDPVGAPLAVFEKAAAVINENLIKVAEDIKDRLN